MIHVTIAVHRERSRANMWHLWICELLEDMFKDKRHINIDGYQANSHKTQLDPKRGIPNEVVGQILFNHTSIFFI